MKNNSECCNNNCNQGRNCPLRVATPAAAETVVLPEPFTTLVHKTSWSSDCYEASPRSNAQEYGRQWADELINVYTEQQVRALLATGGQAQAVELGEVLVTVSGFTGSGKSAIAGEIEILCRALGLQVEWPDGDSEKNMTHVDWTAALEQYKPRVHIVEQNIPFAAMKGMSK